MDINLLPPSQKQRRRTLGLIAYITVGFVLMIAIFGAFALMLTTIQITMSDKITSYQTNTTTLNKQMQQFDTLQKDVATTNKALDQAQTLLKKQLDPNTVIDALAARTGNTIILKSIGASKDPSQSTAIPITLSGDGKDRASIVAFKRTLETGPFQNVQYTISTGSAQGQGAGVGTQSGSSTSNPNTVSFSLTALYTTTQGQKP